MTSLNRATAASRTTPATGSRWSRTCGWRPYGARDIRFLRKGDELYAIALGWPTDGRLTIRSLAKLPGTTGRVTKVKLLGCDGRLEWRHDEQGLTIALPAEKPCDCAYAFRISGKNLTDFRPEAVSTEYSTAVAPDREGNLTLDCDAVELHGGQVQVEGRTEKENVGFWNSASDSVSWKVSLPQAATYEVSLDCATAARPTEFVVEVAGKQLAGKAPETGDWDKYTSVSVGAVTIDKAGEYVLAVRPRDAATWRPMNLMFVRMKRVR